jgi:hypothetical protein
MLLILKLTRASSIYEFSFILCFLFFFLSKLCLLFFFMCVLLSLHCFLFMFTIRWRCHFLFSIGCLLFIYFFINQWHAHQLKFLLLPCFIWLILTFFLFFLHLQFHQFAYLLTYFSLFTSCCWNIVVNSKINQGFVDLWIIFFIFYIFFWTSYVDFLSNLFYFLFMLISLLICKILLHVFKI